MIRQHYSVQRQAGYTKRKTPVHGSFHEFPTILLSRRRAECGSDSDGQLSSSNTVRRDGQIEGWNRAVNGGMEIRSDYWLLLQFDEGETRPDGIC